MSDVNSDNYRDEDLDRYEDHYTEQSDDVVYDEPNDDNRAAAGAGAAGAGSHAAATRAGGLPLRGLAMILIAVAVILALWAAYSMTKGDDSEKTSATGTPSATAPESVQPSQSGNAQPGKAAGNGSAAPSAAAGQNGAQPSNGNQAGQNGAAAANARAGAGAGQTGPTTLNVLNNSTVPGLADNVAKDYSSKGQKVGTKGNLSGDTVTLPQTTVFYKEGDAAGQQAAAQLADNLSKTNGMKVEAKPNIDQLPKETTGPGQITLVLTGQVNVP